MKNNNNIISLGTLLAEIQARSVNIDMAKDLRKSTTDKIVRLTHANEPPMRVSAVPPRPSGVVRVKRRIGAFISIVLAACLGGCTEGNNIPGATAAGAALGGVAGSVLFHGSTQTAAIIGSTVVGGIAGNAVGKNMNDQDKKAACASYPGYYNYQCHPQPPIVLPPPDTQRVFYVEQSPQHCRYVTHAVYIDGVRHSVSGIMCQLSTGEWHYVD